MSQTPVSNLQPSLALTEFVNMQGVFPERDTLEAGAYLGGIETFAGGNEFSSEADGQILPISQDTALFSLMGTFYGGDGRSTFELPNLEGVTMIGAGQGPGLPLYDLGETTGTTSNTLTAAQLPSSLGGASAPVDNMQPSLAVTYYINAVGIYPSQTLTLDSIGVVSAFAGNFAPSGMACDGQLLSISEYEALYTILGTTYGGDGVNTFALPNLNGRDIVGSGPTDQIGTLIGSASDTLTNTNSPTGADAPINNEQPGLVMNYYIMTTGIFPSYDSVATQSSTPELGQVIAFAGTLYSPVGCMLCDGQTLQIAQYQALFAILGTTYGGDGIRTFQLPNLEGRSIVGTGGTNGIGTLGQDSGALTTTLTSSNLPALGAPLLALHSDTGASNTDGITNNGQVDVSGLATGATWSYTVNGGAPTTGTGTSFTLTGSGAKTVGVIQSRGAGDVSGTASLNFTLLTTPPAVTSITTVGASLNDAPSEQFAVTFSESVTGVAASDFALATTGTAAGTIASVTGSGTTYTVTVANTVTGEGTLGLNLDANSSGITDGAGNAAIAGFTGESYTVTQAPCYCLGVMIATERGAVAVENLIIGDHVKTVSGAARPIKWIGTRSFDGRFVGGNRDILPICIQAGALGHDIPDRDLWVSPHHALYLEGVLIEAKDLVNGVSIFQAERVERVEYFHIELFSHDVIIANGAEAETFIDNDSRAMFQNAGDYLALYPNSSARRRASSFAPRRDEGFEIEAARLKIAARAGISAETASPGDLSGWVDDLSPEILSGWARDFSNSEIPVHLHVHADGCLIGRVLANKFRADLMAATGGAGRNGFIFAAPKGVDFSKVRIELRRASDGAVLPCPAQFAA